MTDDRLKMWFGFTLMVALIVLAAVIALGQVHQETSYGLQYILGALAAMAGGWGQWAFTRTKDADKTDEGRKDNPDGPAVH